MIKRIPFYIGCRYILAKKGSFLVSFTSLVSMAGVTLGVVALIVVLSVFNGSQGEMRHRTLITVPHLEISLDGNFDNWQALSNDLLTNEIGEEGEGSIEAIAPFISLEAMISQRGNHEVSSIVGILPEQELQVSTIADYILLGELTDLAPGSFGIFLSRPLAGTLRVRPGDSLNLKIPMVLRNSQAFSVKEFRFTIVGIFDSQFSVGSNLAYIHMDDSASILGLSDSAERLQLRLKLADYNQARSLASTLEAQFAENYPDQNFTLQDWSEAEASLFNALKMEKVMTGFMLMLIVAIGAFNIISTLVMVVSDKRADIAILRTMGISKRSVMAIFLVQGCLVGLGGTIIGAASGIAIAINFSQISELLSQLLSPQEVYMISVLRAELQWPDVYMTCSVALLISFLATLYPAWRASHIHPAEVLRYE